MKRKILSLILVFAMTVSLLTVGTGAVEPTYGDTAGHWAESSIERWSAYGIIQGSNDLFDPNGQLTCAQLATILAKLLKLPAAKDAGFTDNTADAWYFDAINRCAAAGILNGNGDSTVTPEAPITRERAMVMLGRALGIEPIREPDLTKYTDAAKVAPYAQGMVAAMIEAGIVGGVTADELAPQDNINRASTVTILDRAISTYANEAGTTVEASSSGITLVAADNVTVTGTADSVLVSQGAQDGTVTLSSGSAGSVTVTAENATVYVTSESKADDVTLTETAVDSKVVVLKGAEVGTVTTAAPGSTVSVSGKVDTVATTATAEKASVEVAKNATVGEIAASGEKTAIAVSGKVENVTVSDTATDTTVKANSGSTISSVDNAAEGTTVSGSGKVENVTTSGDNTTVSTPGTKVEADKGTTGTTAGNKDVAGGSSTTTPSGGSSSSGGSSHTHSYTTEKVTKEPTCTEAGVKTLTCSCGATKTEEIPATGVHTYTYTDNSDGTHIGTCSVCGAKTEAEAHTVGDEGKCTACGLTGFVARIGTTGYTDLQEALNVGGEVVLVANVTIDGSKTTAEDRLTITKPTTLHLNAKLIAPGSLEPTSNWAALYIAADTIIDASEGGGIICRDKENGECGPYAINIINGANVIINGGEYYGGGTAVQVQLGSLTINDGTFDGTTFGEKYGYNFLLNCVDAPYANGNASITVKGGKFHNFDPSNAKCENPVANFVPVGYGVTQNGENYVVAALFAGGSGTEANPFLISSADQLKAFRDSVNAGTTYSGKYIQLTTDINLNNEEWLPIGEKAGDKFSGTFDGRTHIIEGLSIKATSGIGNEATFDGYAGFFGAINGGTVKDLSVYGSVSGKNVAGVVARVDGNSSVKNCHNHATVTSTNNAKAGGVICLTNAASITVQNCTNSGAVSGGTGGTAGIVAYANPGVTISGCSNTGNIGNASSTYAGGIVGYATKKNSSAGINDCTNSGAITASVSAGGIVGIATEAWTITNCNNSGAVSGTGSSGGIIGSVTNGTISSCSNTATVHGDQFAGGVVGTVASAAQIVNCSGGTSNITSSARTLTFTNRVVAALECTATTCAGRLIGTNQGGGPIVWASITIDDDNGDCYDEIGAIGICGNLTSWANIEIAGGTLHGTPAVGNQTYLRITENASWDDTEGRTPGTYTGTRIAGDTQPVWTLQTP